jgi:hypothetical protein
MIAGHLKQRKKKPETPESTKQPATIDDKKSMGEFKRPGWLNR